MTSKYISIVVFSFFLITCKKSKQDTSNTNPVPYVVVNYTLFPDDPANYRIQTVGGWMYVDNVGLNGIIIYRKSPEEFFVIERTSSHLPNNTAARVYVMSDNFILRDSISDSRWRIIDAQVSQGPAQWPLRTYANTYLNGALRITN